MPPDRAFGTHALPNGAVAIAYDQTLVAEGGTPPYNWSVVSGTLPNGLTLNPATGEITGIPTGLGTQEVTFEVTDANGQMATVTLPVTITISPDLGDSFRHPNLDYAGPFGHLLGQS